MGFFQARIFFLLNGSYLPTKQPGGCPSDRFWFHPFITNPLNIPTWIGKEQKMFQSKFQHSRKYFLKFGQRWRYIWFWRLYNNFRWSRRLKSTYQEVFTLSMICRVLAHLGKNLLKKRQNAKTPKRQNHSCENMGVNQGCQYQLTQECTVNYARLHSVI